MARNSHKSAYHGVFLNHLAAEYIYPQYLGKYCVQSGLLTENIQSIVDKYDDIEAIFLVSPTYEGIVSNIEKISQIAHGRGIPLIVDEAHGAHFHFSNEFPCSALELGADIVIQSVHKTLPCFTQTALMHVKGDLVDIDRLQSKLQIFQSSSPSYLFMAGIEQCIRYMDSDGGKQQMAEYIRMVRQFMKTGGEFKYIKLMDDSIKGKNGVFDRDMSKLLISVLDTPIDGVELAGILRDQYHLELEMAASAYGLAMTSLMDTEEGFARLHRALKEIDAAIGRGEMGEMPEKPLYRRTALPQCQARMRIADVPDTGEGIERVLFSESGGRISGEFITVYPPGAPIVAPGEVLTEQIIRLVEYDRKIGLSVEGMRDESGQTVRVIRED